MILCRLLTIEFMTFQYWKVVFPIRLMSALILFNILTIILYLIYFGWIPNQPIIYGFIGLIIFLIYGFVLNVIFNEKYVEKLKRLNRILAHRTKMIRSVYVGVYEFLSIVLFILALIYY